MPTPSHAEPTETLQTSAPSAISGPELPLPPEVTPAQPHPDPDPAPSAFDRLLTFLSRTLGLDRAIVFTLVARGWSALAGIGTLALISRFLSPDEQGYYYTFYSLVALQIVFELGFSVVVLQTASHEAAHLHISPSGEISGPPVAHARLASVLQKSVRWYTVAALLMAAILIPVGQHFFASQAASHPSAVPTSWFGPWILVVLASAATFQIDPTFSFLEGCGYVPQVARTRLLQAVLGTLLGWGALLGHHGLFAPGLMILGQAVAGAAFLLSRRRLLLPLVRYPAGDAHIDWRTEVWPFQWRIAISWLCGYFTFQLFNPILFAFRGRVEAGQMGMSMNVCGTLSSMAIAWMNTKAGPFGRMIALRDFRTLDTVFFRALVQSTAAAVLASTGVWLVIVFLRAHGVAFALRLLPPLPLAMLFFATVGNIVVFGYAVYLRAHKQEKFVVNSVVGALWMAPAALLFGRSHGALGIAAAYFWGTIVIGLGFGTWTFTKYRRLWHA